MIFLVQLVFLRFCSSFLFGVLQIGKYVPHFFYWIYLLNLENWFKSYQSILVYYSQWNANCFCSFAVLTFVITEYCRLLAVWLNILKYLSKKFFRDQNERLMIFFILYDEDYDRKLALENVCTRSLLIQIRNKMDFWCLKCVSLWTSWINRQLVSPFAHTHTQTRSTDGDKGRAEGV